MLDIAVVETLTGVGEGRDAAEAIARDYAATTPPPGRARRPPRGRTEPRRDGELATLIRRPRRRASRGARSDPRRRRTLRPGARVALPRPARGRASVLRRAAAGAPPRAASRAAARRVDGLVELTAGTRPRAGSVDIDPPRACRALPARRRHRHARMAGGAARARPAHRHARLAARRCSSHRAVPRARPRGEKDAVAHTRVSVGRRRPSRAAARLWALLAERPCHLLIESGGGGVHAYWQARPSPPATRSTREPAGAVEAIERANARLIHCLGSMRTAARPSPTRPAASASRLDAARRHGQRQDRPVRADPRGRLPADAVLDRALVGDLPDPTPRRHARATSAQRRAPGPVQADSPPRVLRATRRDRGAARRAGALPGALARRPAPVLLGRNRPDNAAGTATPAAVARAARSTTSPRCCSAARGAASCAASSSNAPAPTSPTSSANSPDTKQPTRREPRCSRSPLTPPSRSRCARSASRTPAAAPPPC